MVPANHISFSVCTSVYKNDDPAFVRVAMDSIIRQTVKPDEIIIVRDGPVPEELQRVLNEYQEQFQEVRVIPFEKNQGLGYAMRTAVAEAQYDIIARMDSDDIAVPNRFEQQLSFLEEHPDIDIVGGQISEFIGSPDNIVSYRLVPISNDDIYAFIKERCPFNHMTIMARKQAVLQAGNYIEWHYNEDYYLWIRMALKHCKFANMPYVLVNVRSGEGMYKRRGGWKYFDSERGIQRFMLKNDMISPLRYCYNVLARFVIQVILPDSLRGYVFQKLFRKRP